MIFLDANILFELLFNRSKCELVQKLVYSQENNYISILTAHLVYHFGKKNKFSIEQLDTFMLDFKILNSGQEVYDLAKKIRKNDDFEDALQVATAIYNQVDEFYTLDNDLIKKYNNLIKITELK
jgi:predicted nucleic acid-binding protein